MTSHSTVSKPSTCRGSAARACGRVSCSFRQGIWIDQLHASVDGRRSAGNAALVQITSQLRGAPLDLLPADPPRGSCRRRGSVSHRLMVRAGLVRQLGAGLWTWLPAGYRVVKRVEAIIREEIDAIGGQEMLMPVLQPAELVEAARGRYDDRGALQAQGPQGLRSRARADPRGGGHLPRGPRDPLLPRAAEDPLPRAAQGARRATPARRRPAHPRVHDEGLLLVRPRPGRPRGEPTTSIAARTRGSTTAPACAGTRSRATSG